MKDKVEKLKLQLEKENKTRGEDMNSVYGVRHGKNNLIHKFNNTKMFIKLLRRNFKRLRLWKKYTQEIIHRQISKE